MSEPATRRYDLLQRIAAGGMGEVFRAQVSGEHGFSKNVAVKRILPELARDPALLVRFVAEAKMAVALSHANIVQVFDLCRTDDELLIVMELVEGADLGMLLAAMSAIKERTPLGIALYLLMEALKALVHAHGATPGIVHCDISPSNLLVSQAGEVKVTDFGVAQSLSRARRTAGNSVVMGKLRYMSPEQLRGEAIDARTDLYSLGVVAWEMLAMQPLFHNPTRDEAEVVRAVLGPSPPRVSTLRPDVPASLDALVAQMIEKSASARPASALDLVQTLSRVAHEIGPSVTAPEVGAWVRGLLRGYEPLPAHDVTGTADAPAFPPAGELTSLERPLPSSGQPLSVRPRTLTFKGQTTHDGLLVLREVEAPPPPSRRSWLPVVAALALVAGMVGFVALRTRSTTQIVLPPETVVTPTPVVTPTLGDSIAAPPPVDPQLSHDPPPRPKPRPRAPEGEGFLNVTAEPWAYVSIDGREVGTTPLFKQRLSAGDHKIRLRPEHGAAVVRRVHIAPGATELVSVELGGDSSR